MVEECKKARAVGYKCPYCMGAGYMLTNFWPGENDGKQNKPANGDQIWENGKYTIYGGGSGQSGNNSHVENNSQASDNQKKTNPPTIEETKRITTTIATTETSSKTETTKSSILLPGDRGSDFSLTPNLEEDKQAKASASIEVGKMSQKESSYYASLSDEELGNKLTKVQKIVNTANPGKFDTGVQEALDKIVKQNNMKSLKEGRILPIYFEGHENLGFPVKVQVKLNKGVLDGGCDLYMYHVTESGNVEDLGKVEYSTYNDGSVQSIAFYTTGFSSFFTSGKQLDVAKSEKIFEETFSALETNTKNAGNETIFIIIGIVAAVVLIGVATVVFVKRCKMKQSTDT